MVGGVPVGLALRDLFYAAGLGFLLCVGSAMPRCGPLGRFCIAARL